jgi:dTDP-alpha-D-glucose dehydrogenase
MLPVVSRQINDAMPVYSADMVDEMLAQAHPDVEKAQVKVAILGAAFKNDTGDCRFTPTAAFIKTLVARGYDVTVCDPLVTAADAEKWLGLELNPSIDDTLQGANCVAILAGHSMFRELTARDIAAVAAGGALVFDGRRFYTRGEIDELRAAGLEYKGVGRV